MFLLVEESQKASFFSPANMYNEFVLSPLFGFSPPRQGRLSRWVCVCGGGGGQGLSRCCVDVDRFQKSTSDAFALVISIPERLSIIN